MHGTVSEDLQLSFFLNKKHYNDVATSDTLRQTRKVSINILCADVAL